MAGRKSFLLRHRRGSLGAGIEAWAQADLRSVNGQIEYLLRQAMEKRKGRQPARSEDESPVPRRRLR